jgi:hypothetical protein
LRWDPPPSAVVDLRLTLSPALRSSASRRPPSETGKMLLTDFCNRLATCALRRTGRFPRWLPRFHAAATSDGASAPADDPGRDAFDDAPRAGFDHASRAAPIRRVRTLPDPAEPPIEAGPTDSVSRAVALSSTDESSVSTSDAPVATRVGLIGPARVAETAFPAPSSKVTVPNGPGRLPPTSCLLGRRTFARRPRTQTRHRSQDFAALVRLPTLFRPSSRRRGARPCRFRPLFAPGRSWPRAARRLLQPKRSASTTAAFETPV